MRIIQVKIVSGGPDNWHDPMFVGAPKLDEIPIGGWAYSPLTRGPEEKDGVWLSRGSRSWGIMAPFDDGDME